MEGGQRSGGKGGDLGMASLLDLTPPSGHGDLFHLILGRLRLQDLQVTRCGAASDSSAAADTEVSSVGRPCCCAADSCAMPSWDFRRSCGSLQVSAFKQCAAHSASPCLSDKRHAGLRSGLVPLHPAFGSPDVRQALAAQQRLHSSIFGGDGSSRRRPELLGGDIVACAWPDQDFCLVVHVVSSDAEGGEIMLDYHITSLQVSQCPGPVHV